MTESGTPEKGADGGEPRARSRRMREQALEILAELDLMGLWGRFGRPVLVGATAYDLVWDPDLDMEIYCPRVSAEQGFRVLGECASRNPRVLSARYDNLISGPDRAYYWQLRYRAEEGTEWKVDMWSAPEDYDLPRSEYLVEPMNRALNEELRALIVGLKAARRREPGLECLSIDLYRAVLEDGVRSPETLREWLASNETGGLSAWRPRPRG